MADELGSRCRPALRDALPAQKVRERGGKQFLSPGGAVPRPPFLNRAVGHTNRPCDGGYRPATLTKGLELLLNLVHCHEDTTPHLP